jgi:ATP-dependent RNA helicase DeaD
VEACVLATEEHETAEFSGNGAPGMKQGVEALAVLKDFPFLQASIRRLGFQSLTAVQEVALPLVLNGHSLIIQARTGSGKTLTYALPALAHLQTVLTYDRIQTLIVTPTRELAIQVQNVLKSLDADVAPVLLIGGTALRQAERSLKTDQRIVVGTPGRILDMMRRRALSLEGCRFFALDEADEMLSMGFIEEVEGILSELPRGIQGVFTSATVTGRVSVLAKKYLLRHQTVVVDTPTEDDEKGGEITHYALKVSGDLLAKPQATVKILEHFSPRSAIIFCNTKSDTEFVEAILKKRGVSARRINSDLSQSQRSKVMKDLRDGTFTVLIATDLAARGIDIDQIDLVINYSLHEQQEAYVHRTGRTGRAGRSGAAVSLIGPRDISTHHFLKKVLEGISFQDLVLEGA